MPRSATRTIALLPMALLLALAAAPGARADDHKAYREAKPDDCRRGSGVMDNHGPTFLQEHRKLAQKSSANCAACHEQSFCLDCHTGGNLETDAKKGLSRRGEPMPYTHEPDYVSIHALKARDDPQTCNRCHEPKFCSDCHVRWNAKVGLPFSVRPHAPVYASPGVLDPTWVSSHRAEARRNLRSCQACHPNKADCSNFACHSSLGGR